MSANEPMRERLIVVGNGMVGMRFVEKLVARAEGRYRISIIGKEPQPAYNRVLLSSLLAGEVSAPDVRFRDRGWYAEHGLELLLARQPRASTRARASFAWPTVGHSPSTAWFSPPARSLSTHPRRV